ncbi:helix-turn-helix domain-containing protein [Mycolicibacterium smegmatis]|nr:helix-turn-helix domain-containing protein [Mycolicibacterium smegmatis]
MAMQEQADPPCHDQEVELSRIRNLADLTQAQLAEAMGTKQTVVSRLERQTDWKLSTLASYLNGCGVDAKLVVKANGRTLVLRPTATGTFEEEK